MKIANIFPQIKLCERSTRIYFEGILCILDEPSDKPPMGGLHHKLIIPSAVAKKALPSLIGAPLNYKVDWSGHDFNMTIGMITNAKIINHTLQVVGFLSTADKPYLIRQFDSITDDLLGMSIELHNSRVDITKKYMVALEVNFSGAAVLLKNKAAYTKTSFHRLKNLN
jgi:hypothetical protein